MLLVPLEPPDVPDAPESGLLLVPPKVAELVELVPVALAPVALAPLVEAPPLLVLPCALEFTRLGSRDYGYTHATNKFAMYLHKIASPETTLQDYIAYALLSGGCSYKKIPKISLQCICTLLTMLVVVWMLY